MACNEDHTQARHKFPLKCVPKARSTFMRHNLTPMQQPNATLKQPPTPHPTKHRRPSSAEAAGVSRAGVQVRSIHARTCDAFQGDIVCGRLRNQRTPPPEQEFGHVSKYVTHVKLWINNKSRRSCGRQDFANMCHMWF